MARGSLTNHERQLGRLYVEEADLNERSYTKQEAIDDVFELTGRSLNDLIGRDGMGAVMDAARRNTADSEFRNIPHILPDFQGNRYHMAELLRQGEEGQAVVDRWVERQRNLAAQVAFKADLVETGAAILFGVKGGEK